MSKLFKSKFFLGTLIFAGLVIAVAGVANTASADCGITHTLKVGSPYHSEVMCLQSSLDNGLAADGAFGPHTKAAVMAWQHANGLVADGIFGPMSRAAWEASLVGVHYPAGCMSNSGYSSTTGLPCAGATFPAGCTSAVGYSPTTGAPCNGTVGVTLPAGCATASGFSSTTGQPCTATSVSTGTNGYLADIASDSSGRVSTVYESESDKVVAGFRATARLADQTVNRVRVQFRNTDTGGSSVNLGKYISSASLWFNGSKIATMAVGQADRSISDDTYTFNFSGISAKIPKDQVGHFYVAVSANGSLDTTDASNANWAVVFPSGGVQAVSPDGSVDTYDMAAGNVGTLLGSNVGFTFGKFSANGVKATVGLSSSNPAATTLAVNNTSATNDVTLLKFTVKATNSSLTLRKVPIQIVTTGDNVSSIVSTVKLYKGSTLVDSLDASAGTAVNGSNQIVAGACTTTCGFIFSNLSSPENMINSGDTAEFTVKVDIKAQSNFTAGDTIKASLVNADVLLTANFGVLDANGDQLTAGATYRIGSAVGEVMTLLVNGVNVAQGACTAQNGCIVTTSDSGVVTKVTYNIPLTVTAFGQTLYTGQAAELAAAASGTGASAKAFSFALQEAAAPAVDIVAAPTGVTVSSTLSSNASIENLGYRLDSGSAKNYTLQVILTCSAGACSTATTANYRVHVGTVRTDTLNTLAAPTNQTLLPAQNYQTGFQTIK